MKAGIHPETKLATVSCSSCGASFVTRSTAGELTVEVCSQCHPAYTGRAAKVAGGSRIERFERRLERADAGSARLRRGSPARR
jgi:large subunit ribosomal protein L31